MPRERSLRRFHLELIEVLDADKMYRRHAPKACLGCAADHSNSTPPTKKSKFEPDCHREGFDLARTPYEFGPNSKLIRMVAGMPSAIQDV